MQRPLSRRALLSLAAISSVALAGTRGGAQAAEPPVAPSCPPPGRRGLIGVAPGQLLRVSLFHDVDPAGIPDSPCLYRIRVLGLDGNELGSAEGTIVPGAGALADFDLATATRSVKPQFSRVECYVAVDRAAGHPVWATAEVYDAKTGATGVIGPPDLPPGIIGPPDQPADGVIGPVDRPADPGMGTVGIVDGLLARISLFHALNGYIIPTSPCGYEVTVHGIDGKLLAEHKGQVAPGQGVFFDHDLAAGVKKPGRVQFHVHVHAEHPELVASALQLYDARTGESTVGAVVIPCSL